MIPQPSTSTAENAFMSTENQPTFVRIALTEEQRAQVRQSTGV